MNSNDPNRVLVQPVRSFNGVEGFKHPSSPAFAVSRGRAAELKANGLVRDAGPADTEAVGEQSATKRAPATQNRMAPDAQNKGRAK